MAATRQSAVSQGIMTPSKPANKAHQTPKIPNTPSTLYRNNFDFTPGSQTTNSFHDSGYFSSPNTESYSHKSGYQDWVLFPEEPETPYLDTGDFFADADQVVYDEYSADAYPQTANISSTPSYDSAPTLSAYDAALDEELYNTVRLALRSCHLSSPPSPRPHKSPRMREIDVEVTTPLKIWQGSIERHEDIACRLEQGTIPTRGGFRQQSRVERRRSRQHRSRRN